MTETTRTATIRRFMNDEHEAIFAVGTFDELFQDWADHIVRYEPEPDGLSAVMMRQGLAAAALHLSCRPRDERCAWTINTNNPPMNVFLTGDAESCSVTGRVFTEGVATTESSRMFVESQRPHGRDSKSVIEVEGLDVLDIFEQYYFQSVQSMARFFELSDFEFLLVQSLPVDESAWITSLSREKARALFERGRMKELDERVFRFRCGCDSARIVDVVKKMYEGKTDELFEDDETIRIVCPRCARAWNVGREEF